MNRCEGTYASVFALNVKKNWMLWQEKYILSLGKYQIPTLFVNGIQVTIVTRVLKREQSDAERMKNTCKKT